MKKKYWIIAGLSGIGIFGVAHQANKNFEMAKNMEIFSNIYKEINMSYVDEVEPNKFMRTGINAMLESLDPYTDYISEAEMEGFRFQLTGKYGGIGAAIRSDKDHITITEIYEGTPAEEKKLQAGDMIYAIDGKVVKGKTSDQISDILKGTPGTPINLHIRRPFEDKEFDITMNRAEIKIPNVPYSTMLDEHTAYVILTTFSEQAGANIEEALKNLRKKHTIKNIILDLRNNGGGLLTEAVNLCNVFVEKNELIVETKGKVKERDRNFKTLNKAFDTEAQVVVLVNAQSASASEIVSGALQDLDRAVLIGTKTYGKGLVQNTMDVGYNSKVKITTAKYYTPSGRCIQAVKYKNGEPVDISDSMKVAFKTRAGRTVYDGGGVIPDIKVDAPKLSEITKTLLRKNLIFEYGTKYKKDHPSIANPSEFSFTDAEYQDFLNFVKDKDIVYETDSELALKRLEDKAKSESFYDNVKDDIAAMRQDILNEKKNDFTKHKKEIITLIEDDAMARYYLDKGRREHNLKHDKMIQEALKLFKTPEEYKRILKEK